MKWRGRRSSGTLGMIFKNRIVYPIRIFSLAKSIFYAETIVDADVPNTLFIRADSDYVRRHPDWDGLCG